MRRPMLKLCSIAAVAGLVAIGCGSSKKKTTTNTTAASSGASTTAGGTTNGTITSQDAMEVVKNDPLSGTAGTGKTRGITATQIKVGCEYNATAFTGADDGFKARFDRANKEGLPGGRKIVFTGCKDDGTNTQNNLTIGKQLVEQDNDFAVFSLSANELPGTTDYFNAQEVPYYGWGFLPGFCQTRWGFGWNGCLISDYAPAKHGVLQAGIGDPIIKAAGLEPKDAKIAIASGEDDSGKIGSVSYKKLYDLRGAQVVYNVPNIPVPGPPSDFTPFTRAVLASNPNIIVISTAFTDVGGLAASLKAAGTKAAIFNYVAYVPGLLSVSPQLADALDGTYIDTQIVPEEQQTDWVKQIENDLVASGAKNGKFITLAGQIAYAEADMFVQQITAVGKDLNTKTFDQKVNGGDFTYQPSQSGGIGKVPFPAGHIAPADCAAIVKIVNKAYTVAEPFACFKTAVVR